MARGEITVIVAGTEKQADSEGDQALLVRALQLLLPELPPARAAAIAAQLAGCKRSDAYERALRMRADLKSNNFD
jgi:16S rRNA C1402 (ribose-2'-O) methylase RsmI